LVGFTSAEGCFLINLNRSSLYRTGYQVQLVFTISQHNRDAQLMTSLIEYLGCGNVYENRKEVNFTITKFKDLENKVIPLFANHPVLGVKYLDYLDFVQVSEIIKNKAHITEEGLEEIRKIKARMNKGRDFFLPMKEEALGIKHAPSATEDTKLKMSTKRGNPVNIYEKCSSEGFKLIGSFVSARRAGKFLGMSGSTVNRYLNSGAIFKDRYKFSYK
jgi:hypothetical protein